MIRHDNRFDDYAYRNGEFNMSAELLALATIEEGLHVSLNASGELVKSSGAKKSYVLTTSKVPGRDQISGKHLKKGTVLIGSSCLYTDQVVKGEGITYAPGDPLYVSADGLLTKTASTSAIVEAYALSALQSDGTLRVQYTA